MCENSESLLLKEVIGLSNGKGQDICNAQPSSVTDGSDVNLRFSVESPYRRSKCQHK